MPVELHPQTQEAQLASLGGWQEQEVQDVRQPSQPKTSEPLPLLDEDDRVTPEQIQQERPWWMGGTPRMIVAGSATMGVLYVLFSMFGLWGSSQEPSPSLMATDATAIDQEVTARIKQLQTENENLKRQQVMGEPLPLSQPSPQPQQTKPAVAVPPKPRVVYAPAPRRADVAGPARVSRPTSYAPPPPSAPALPKPLPPTKVEPKADPMEKWIAASNIGSWGGSSSSSDSPDFEQSSTPADTASYDTADTTWQIRGGSGQATVTANEPKPIRTGSAIAQRNTGTSVPHSESSDYQPASSSTFGGRRLAVGTEVEGKLDTEVRWSENRQNQFHRKILIELKEPLQGVNGLEVLPKGTHLVAQIAQTSGNGAVQMSVAAAIAPNGFEQAIPPQAILILSKDGDEFLQAKTTRPNRGGSDVGSVFLSGLSSATGVIDSSIGQGAARTVLQQLRSRRQQRQYSEIQSTTFVLKQGTPVRLYVNQPIAID